MSQFHQDRALAEKEYRKFVKEGSGIDVWADLRGGVILGTERFVEALEPLLRGRSPMVEIPRRERLVSRPRLEELFSGIKDKSDRNERIYQAVRVYGYTLKEVANSMELYYSTVSVIANRAAEARKHQK
ncbi:MAG: hypothetical protein PHX35_04230 [Candidatus Bipolaricaulis anaerobius]|nr:hypothetical protein [Candidatus Bipolaricaulis anaerobius]